MIIIILKIMQIFSRQALHHNTLIEKVFIYISLLLFFTSAALQKILLMPNNTRPVTKVESLKRVRRSCNIKLICVPIHSFDNNMSANFLICRLKAYSQEFSFFYLTYSIHHQKKLILENQLFSMN